jgi:DNA polymerase-3 subunit epsilon
MLLRKQCGSCSPENRVIDDHYYQEVQPILGTDNWVSLGFGWLDFSTKHTNRTPALDRSAIFCHRLPYSVGRSSSPSTEGSASPPIPGDYMRTLYLDTETTGLSGDRDRVVEIAIIGDHGEVLVDTLVNPGISIPREASAIHGITDIMVRSAPAFSDLWPKIEALVRDSRVVIYNASFDIRFLPQRLSVASDIQCAMLAYAAKRGQRTPKQGRYRRHKLADAAAYVGHQWSSAAHRARADAEACRSVWRWTNGYPIVAVTLHTTKSDSAETLKVGSPPPAVQDNYRKESVLPERPSENVANRSMTELYQLGIQAAGEEDYVVAVRLWRLAAEQGHSKAQYNLGVAFAHGKGVPINLVEALDWWRRAAEKGHDLAARELAKTKDSDSQSLRRSPESGSLFKAAFTWLKKALGGR